MPSKVVELVYRAKDEATPVQDAVMRGTDRLAEKIDNLTKVTEGLWIFDKILGVFDALKAKVNENLESFAQYEQATIKLQTILKSTGGAAGYTSGQLVDYAGSLNKASLFSKTLIVDAEAIMATFTKVSGEVFLDATRAAMDLSAALGQDLQGSVIQIGKALNNPITGITALRRVGVSFTKEQESTIDRLMAENKLFEAQKLILAELATEFGGVAAAVADTTSGRIMKFNKLFDGINRRITEALAQPLARLEDLVAPGLKAIADLVEVIAKKSATIFDAALPFWQAATQFMVDAVDRATFSVINWKETWGLGVAFVKVQLSELWDLLQYIFVEAIPAAFRATLAELKNLGGALEAWWVKALRYVDDFTRRAFGGGGGKPGAQVNAGVGAGVGIPATQPSGSTVGFDPGLSSPKSLLQEAVFEGTLMKVLGLGVKEGLATLPLLLTSPQAPKIPESERHIEWMEYPYGNTSGNGPHPFVVGDEPGQLQKALDAIRESMSRIAAALPGVQWSERTQRLQAELDAVTNRAATDFAKWKAGMPGAVQLPQVAGGGRKGDVEEIVYRALAAREVRLGGMNWAGPMDTDPMSDWRRRMAYRRDDRGGGFTGVPSAWDSGGGPLLKYSSWREDNPPWALEMKEILRGIQRNTAPSDRPAAMDDGVMDAL